MVVDQKFELAFIELADLVAGLRLSADNVSIKFCCTFSFLKRYARKKSKLLS